MNEARDENSGLSYYFSDHANDKSSTLGFMKPAALFMFLFGDRFMDTHGNIAYMISAESIEPILEKIKVMLVHATGYSVHLTPENVRRKDRNGKLVVTVIDKKKPSGNWEPLVETENDHVAPDDE